MRNINKLFLLHFPPRWDVWTDYNMGSGFVLVSIPQNSESHRHILLRCLMDGFLHGRTVWKKQSFYWPIKLLQKKWQENWRGIVLLVISEPDIMLLYLGTCSLRCVYCDELLAVKKALYQNRILHLFYRKIRKLTLTVALLTALWLSLLKSNYSCGVEGKLSPSPHTTKVTQFPLCHTSSIYFLKMNISGVFSSDWGKGRHKGYILERKKVKM